MRDFPDGAIILHGLEGAFRQLGEGDVSYYGYDDCIRELISQGMSFDEAIEHFEFNVLGGRSMYPKVFFEGWDDVEEDEG